MATFPKITDVHVSKMRIRPGDRVIARVYIDLDRQQKRNLRRAVQKWVGDAEVLIVDMRLFDIEVDSARRIV